MNDLDISIIIPTHNRKDLLKRVLELYAHQAYPALRFEIIVVDDGSTDNTEDTLRGLQNKIPYRLSYIKQNNKGPASARNRGIDEARSNIILFTGDDILPKEDLIEQHLKLHRKFGGIAVLGFVDWSKDLGITDFMHYIAPNGLQFRYGNIRDADNCDHRYFYTSNISLAKEWFVEDRFDEDFPFAALEDAELAYRLKKKGLKIIFNKKAIGYHYHHATLESFCKRMKMTGFSAIILIRKHPELKTMLLPVNIWFAKMIARGLKGIPFLEKISRKLYWFSQIAISYIEGVEEARGKIRE